MGLVDVIDRKGLYRADGHRSAKVMVRHVAKLSGAEAAARARSAKALRDLPETRAGLGAGEVGTCQVRRLARAHADPRVRDRLPEFEGPLLRVATAEPFKVFDEVVGDWVRLADEDGTCADNQRHHENRDFRPTRDFEAEFRTDWDKAKIEHGDATTKEHLRTHPHRPRWSASCGGW